MQCITTCGHSKHIKAFTSKSWHNWQTTLHTQWPTSWLDESLSKIGIFILTIYVVFSKHQVWIQKYNSTDQQPNFQLPAAIKSKAVMAVTLGSSSILFLSMPAHDCECGSQRAADDYIQPGFAPIRGLWVGQSGHREEGVPWHAGRPYISHTFRAISANHSRGFPRSFQTRLPTSSVFVYVTWPEWLTHSTFPPIKETEPQQTLAP